MKAALKSGPREQVRLAPHRAERKATLRKATLLMFLLSWGFSGAAYAQKGYVLDGFGGVHAMGGAPVLAPATPYFGFDIARALRLTGEGSGYYVLDGFGGVHRGGTAGPISPASPFFGFDIAKDLEFSSGFWSLSGNVGTTSSNFLGTTDNQALELKVNNARVLRLEPGPAYVPTPNIIGGFSGNSVTAGVYGATIGGGGSSPATNRVTDDAGTVGGGEKNQAGDNAGMTWDRRWATVGGGLENTASGLASTVGGGRLNTASALGATVAGGGWAGGPNTASADFATVGGGYGNTASHISATVPGGGQNLAGEIHSFAAGHNAKAIHEGSFVWGDNSPFDVPSGGPNQFVARATGGFGFWTAIDGSGNPTAGAVLSSGSGSWSSLSDESAKADVAPADPREILAEVVELPVTTWRYEAQDDSVRHIGPMAQDFHKAFGVGEDPRYISTVDADGVMLAAIQGLYQLLKEKEGQIMAQQRQITALEARLARLEQAVSR